MAGDDTELWGGQATDPVLGFHVGRAVLVNVHPQSACAGWHCVLHNPSGHHMCEWPTVWRDDRGMMERTCPHGIGHPDPDDAAYRASRGDGDTVHGCDGCCRPPVTGS